MLPLFADEAASLFSRLVAAVHGSAPLEAAALALLAALVLQFENQ
jgi:hypothetical protein